LNKIIEIIVSPTGETRLETKGFVGAECQEASKFLECMGERKAEELTTDFHQSHEIRQTSQQRN
jgi:Protein of unknown function (DUF2997)